MIFYPSFYDNTWMTTSSPDHPLLIGDLFRRNAAVVPDQAPLHRLAVAERAFLLPGVLFLVGHDRVDRRRTVVPKLAKRRWDQ